MGPTTTMEDAASVCSSGRRSTEESSSCSDLTMVVGTLSLESEVNTPSTICSSREFCADGGREPAEGGTSSSSSNLDASLRVRHVGWLWQQRINADPAVPTPQGQKPPSQHQRAPPLPKPKALKQWQSLPSGGTFLSSLSEAAAELEAAAAEAKASAASATSSRSGHSGPPDSSQAPYGQHVLRRSSSSAAACSSGGSSSSRTIIKGGSVATEQQQEAPFLQHQLRSVSKQQQPLEEVDWMQRTGLSLDSIQSLSKAVLQGMILAEAPGFQGFHAFEAVAAWAERALQERAKDACELLAHVDFSRFSKAQLQQARQQGLVQVTAALQARIIQAGGAALPARAVAV